jgi:hypothetical protein
VWLFAQGMISGSPQETLFHWSPSASPSLASFAVDTSDASLNAGLETPIVVDQSGRAWLGINQTLLIAAPGSSGLTTVSLPAVTVGAPGSGLPTVPVANPGATVPIESLALGPGNTIVVGRAFATELQVVDVASLTVSSIPLPTGTALAGLGPNDIASDPGGNVVAAVLYSGSGVHELGQYVNGTWTIDTEPCPAYAATVSAQTLVVAGPSCVAAGAIDSDDPATTAPVALTTVNVQGLPQGSSQAIALNSSTVLADLGNGIVSASAGSQSSPVSLGTTVPGPSSFQASSSPAPVPIRLALVTAASQGGVWFVPDAGAVRVGLVSP